MAPAMDEVKHTPPSVIRNAVSVSAIPPLDEMPIPPKEMRRRLREVMGYERASVHVRRNL